MKIKTKETLTFFTQSGKVTVKKGAVLVADLQTKLGGTTYYRFVKRGEDFFCSLDVAEIVAK